MNRLNELVSIWTDGACSGNPGPGGWGAVLSTKGVEKELSGSDPATTNNRMELMAAIAALEALKRPVNAVLHTDSSYVRNGVTLWLSRWKQNGWRTSDGKPVANADLWLRLERAAMPHCVEWRWVKGHAGDPMNERADALARSAIKVNRGGE